MGQILRAKHGLENRSIYVFVAEMSQFPTKNVWVPRIPGSIQVEGLEYALFGDIRHRYYILGYETTYNQVYSKCIARIIQVYGQGPEESCGQVPRV